MSATPAAYQPDPATRQLLANVVEAGVPPMHTLSPAQARDGMLAGKAADIEPPALQRIENSSIPGPAGDVPVRFYYPDTAAPAAGYPCLVYFHGGGFVIGDLDTHDILCRQLCELADVLVVSVDYRLAPEHIYPAAVEDSLAGLDWVEQNFAQIGADPSRLAVAGDSAGGTLAAIAAQHARDKGLQLKAQLLFYPVVDLSKTYPSHAEHINTFPLYEPVLAWFWSHYLSPEREADQQLREHPRVSPILIDDFSNLAPAYVVTAGLDPLRDEGAAYAQCLNRAGVDTQYQCAMGTVHGFLRLGQAIPSARDTIVNASHFLKRRI